MPKFEVEQDTFKYGYKNTINKFFGGFRMLCLGISVGENIFLGVDLNGHVRVYQEVMRGSICPRRGECGG